MTSHFVTAYSPPPAPTPKRTNLSKPFLIDTHLEPQKLGPDSTGKLYVKVRNIGKTGEISVVTMKGTHFFIRPSSKMVTMQENETKIFNFTIITTHQPITNDTVVHINVIGEMENSDSGVAHIYPRNTPYTSFTEDSRDTAPEKPISINHNALGFVLVMVVLAFFVSRYIEYKK